MQRRQADEIKGKGGLGGQLGRMGDALSGLGRQAVYGFNEGLANIARPVDEAIRLGTGNVQRVEQPNRPTALMASPDAVPTGPGVSGLLDALPDEDPESTAQRVARAGGEFAGETAPLTGGLLGMANRLGTPLSQAAPEAGNLAQRTAQSFLDAVGRAPGAATAVDATASFGAGAGGQIGEEIAPGSTGARVAGELIGGVATPLLPFAMPAVTGTRLITRAMEAASPTKRAQRATDHIAGVMGDQLSAPAARTGIAEAERLRGEIPGFNPSLAEATGAPSLTVTQRAAEGRMQGRELEEAMLRREANEEALALHAARQAPGETADPAIALRGAEERVEGLSGQVARQQETAAERAAALQRQIEAERAGAASQKEALEAQRREVGETQQDRTAETAQQALERQAAEQQVRETGEEQLRAVRERADLRAREIAESLPASVDYAAVGGRMRDRVIAARREAMTAMSARADELGLDRLDFTVPFRQFAANVAETAGPGSAWRRMNSANRMPEEYDSIQNFALLDRDVTFADVKDLREDIGAALREAGAKGEYAKERTLAIIRREIDETLLSPEAFPENEAYRQWRREYFENVVEPFEQGAALNVRGKTGKGFYRTLDEDVAGRFTSSQSHARQYWRLFGDNPQAVADMEAALVDDLVSSAVRDGVVNPAAVDAWMRRKSGVLNEMPPVRERFDETARVVRDMERAQRETAEQVRRTTQQALGELRRERIAIGQQRLESQTGATEQRRGIDDQIRQVEAAAEDRIAALGEQLQPVLDRIDTLKSRQQQIDSSNLARRLKSVARHQQTPDDLIREAVRKPGLMTQLLSASRNDPGAQRALRRNVWDQAAGMDGETLLRYITDNRPALQRLFGDTHLKALEDIQTARMMTERVPAPAGQEIVVDPVEMVRRATGHNPSAAIARYVAVQRGRSSKTVEFGAALSYWLRNFSIGNRERLMKEALYNPTVARNLADMIRVGDPKIVKPMKAYGWLMNVSGQEAMKAVTDDDR